METSSPPPAASVLMMDVDGVLVRGRPKDGLHYFTDLEADLGLSPDLLREEFFKPHWEEIVTGRAPLVERLASVLARVRPELAAEALIAYWFDNDSRIDQDVLAAMASYRQRGLGIYLATNQEHLRASYLLTEMGLGAHVDGIVYSAEIGHRKPNPDFYRIAVERADATASQIVLVDDTLANVEAARECGWQGVHWTGDGDLHEALAPLLGGDRGGPPGPLKLDPSSSPLPERCLVIHWGAAPIRKLVLVCLWPLSSDHDLLRSSRPRRHLNRFTPRHFGKLPCRTARPRT